MRNNNNTQSQSKVPLSNTRRLRLLPRRLGGVRSLRVSAISNFLYPDKDSVGRREWRGACNAIGPYFWSLRRRCSSSASCGREDEASAVARHRGLAPPQSVQGQATTNHILVGSALVLLPAAPTLRETAPPHHPPSWGFGFLKDAHSWWLHDVR